MKILPFFLVSKQNNFKEIGGLIKDNLIKEGVLDLDTLFCLIVNHLLSFYFSEGKEDNNRRILKLKEEILKFSTENEGIFSEITLKLLEKLLTFDEFVKKVVDKQKDTTNLTQEQFEILMFGLRFALQSASGKDSNFYNNLLRPHIKEYINNSYIIGNLPFNNVFVKTYYSLNVLMRVQKGYGFYVCTCGQFYILENCTCPNGIFPCYNPNCKLQISGTGHKMLGPEAGQTDHWRIILEEDFPHLSNEY